VYVWRICHLVVLYYRLFPWTRTVIV